MVPTRLAPPEIVISGTRLPRSMDLRKVRRDAESFVRAVSKEYYLNRPVVKGVDDRGGAMALLAAVEVETLLRVH